MRPATVTATEPRPAAMEAALRALWRQRAETGQGGTRARLATLISICQTPEETAMAQREIAALNRSRPVRSLIASLYGNGMEATAALACNVSPQHDVCYEQICVRAGEDSVRALPSLLDPLIVPGLPAFLWIPGDLTVNEALLDRLFSLSDRVVTDSHSFSAPLQAFRSLDAWVRQCRGSCVFTEMTWTRMGTWREAVGKLFDPEDSRQFLARVSEVIVTSVRGPGFPPDRALLMVGWLAAKLGWAAKGVRFGDDPIATFAAPHGDVPVRFVEGPPAARGHLLGLEIVCPDVLFRVERVRSDPSGAIRSCIICSGDEAERPAYSPPLWQPHELLCSAMEIRSPFTDWEDALASIAALEEA